MFRNFIDWLKGKPTLGKKSSNLGLTVHLVLDKAPAASLHLSSGGSSEEDRLVLEGIKDELLTWFHEEDAATFSIDSLVLRRYGLVAIMCKIEADIKD